MKTKFFKQTILRISMLMAVIFSAALIHEAAGQCTAVTKTVSGTGCNKLEAVKNLNYNIGLLAQSVCGNCTIPLNYCLIQNIRNMGTIIFTSVPDATCPGGIRWKCSRKIKYECACTPGS